MIFFRKASCSVADIESGWAGLRPLVNKPGKGPSEISRKDEMFESATGLITIAGGKLTGYRKMAKRVVDLVGEKMFQESGKWVADCSTHTIKLSGGKFMEGSFDQFVQSRIKKGTDLGLSLKESELLTYRYGSNVDEVFEIISGNEKIF